MQHGMEKKDGHKEHVLCNPEVSKDRNGDRMSVSATTKLADVVKFGFYITITIKSLLSTPVPPQKPNAFQLMMAASTSKQYPPYYTREDGRSTLQNKVIDILKEDGAGFTSKSIASGTGFYKTLCDVLWKLDAHRESRDLSFHKLFKKVEGMNNPKAHKHKAQPLKNNELIDWHGSLLNSLDAYWMQQSPFKQIKLAVTELCETLKRLISKLQADVDRKKEVAVMSLADTSDFGIMELPERPLPSNVPEEVGAISATLIELDHYKSTEINSFLSRNRLQRHNTLSYIKANGVGFPAVLYSGAHAGNIENLHFMWKLPSDVDMQEQTKTIDEVRKLIPEYHNKLVRKEFMHAASKLNVNAKYSRYLYRLATSDATAPRTADEKGIDARILTYVETGDENIVLDLRTITKEGLSIYDNFFDAAQKYIDSKVEVAVDERRHDSVVHLAMAMSAADLYRSIQLECAEDVPVPSLAWFCMSFAPKNKRSSARFTGRLKVKRMVQRRQIHQNHIDAHYGSAVYRYLKDMAVKYREHTNMVSCDDKCKVNIGEPGFPIAAVNRGRKVIVGINQTFEVGDHDFSRGSLVPSVTLHVKIPEDVNDSWYNGDVYINLKDAVYQPSSPSRHSLELEQVLSGLDKPILFLYTDGGPDHRCTYLSVMLACIYLWHKLDLDLLILARTPPGNSWKNPSERIMSLLNLGLQSVGVMRAVAADDTMESRIKRCGTMKQLRAEAGVTEGFQEAYTQSVKPARDLLNTVFGRLQWKEKNIKIENPITDDQLVSLMEHLRAYIDTSIMPDDTMANLKDRKRLKTFLDSHCQMRHYSFGVKKCGKEECMVCFVPQLDRETFNGLNFLPDPIPDADGDHYKSFAELYGTKTTAVHRPGLTSKHTKKEVKIATAARAAAADFPNSTVEVRVKESAQTANTVKQFLTCGECLKPRVIYSRYKLSDRQLSNLNSSLESIDYVCSTDLTDFVDDEDVTSILLQVHVAQDVACADEVETAYFTCGSFSPVCKYCGTDIEPLESGTEDHYPYHTQCGVRKKRKYRK